MGRLHIFVPWQLFIKKHVTQPRPPTQLPTARLPLPLQTSHVIAFLACHLLDNRTRNFTFTCALSLLVFQTSHLLLLLLSFCRKDLKDRNLLFCTGGLFPADLIIGLMSHTQNLLQLPVTAPKHCNASLHCGNASY